MHDVCLRKIAPQTTATRHFSTTYDHITDSITTVSFYISGYLTPPALRHKSYTEPDRHSVLFCSVSFRHARPESTRPTLPAASLYRTVLFCAARSIPFRLARVPTDSRQSVPFYSALFHSGPYCPTLLPTHTAPKPIDLVHLLQPKKYAQHISPLCDARQPIKQPTDAVGNISQSNIPLLTILKYKSLVYDRATAGYRSAPPVGCKTAARAIGRDSEDTLPLYGRYKIVMR